MIGYHQLTQPQIIYRVVDWEFSCDEDIELLVFELDPDNEELPDSSSLSQNMNFSCKVVSFQSINSLTIGPYKTWSLYGSSETT